MLRAHHVQCEKAFQRAPIILFEITAELFKHRGFHRIGPVVAAHETRCRREHRQPAHLWQRGGGVQGDQPAQRPATPHGWRCGGSNGVYQIGQAQRCAVVAAVAMARQVDDVQFNVRRKPFDQRCEDAAMQCPAVDQDQCRSTAGDVDMHAYDNRIRR